MEQRISSTICMLLLIALPGVAGAQEQTEPEPPVIEGLLVDEFQAPTLPDGLRLPDLHDASVPSQDLNAALPTSYDYYIGTCSGSAIIATPGVCGTSTVDVVPTAFLTDSNTLVAGLEVVYTKAGGSATFAVGYGEVNVGARPSSGADVITARVAFLSTSATSSTLQCDGFIAFQMDSALGSIREAIFNIGEMDRNDDPFHIEIGIASQTNLANWNYIYVDTCGSNMIVASADGDNLQSTFSDIDAWINVDSGAARGTNLQIHVDRIPRELYAIRDRNLVIGSTTYTQGFHLAGSTSMDGTIDGDIFANDFSAKNLDATLQDARNVWVNWKSSAPFAALAYGMTATNDYIDVEADVKYDPTLVNIHASIDATRLSSGSIEFDNRPAIPDVTLSPGTCAKAVYTLIYECNVNNQLLT